jgi:proteasome lid subunit RPN8/RPN11
MDIPGLLGVAHKMLTDGRNLAVEWAFVFYCLEGRVYLLVVEGEEGQVKIPRHDLLVVSCRAEWVLCIHSHVSGICSPSVRDRGIYDRLRGIPQCRWVEGIITTDGRSWLSANMGR